LINNNWTKTLKAKKIIKRYDAYKNKKNINILGKTEYILFGEDEFQYDHDTEIINIHCLGKFYIPFDKDKNIKDIEFLTLKRKQGEKGGEYDVGMFQHKNPFGGNSPLKSKDGCIYAVPYLIFVANGTR
jgi:hypothetical protein